MCTISLSPNRFLKEQDIDTDNNGYQCRNVKSRTDICLVIQLLPARLYY